MFLASFAKQFKTSRARTSNFYECYLKLERANVARFLYTNTHNAIRILEIPFNRLCLPRISECQLYNNFDAYRQSFQISWPSIDVFGLNGEGFLRFRKKFVSGE